MICQTVEISEPFIVDADFSGYLELEFDDNVDIEVLQVWNREYDTKDKKSQKKHTSHICPHDTDPPTSSRFSLDMHDSWGHAETDHSTT